MAKEPEVYVGKEGAQELYRKIKAEIGKFTAFQKAEPAADGTPDIDLADRKTNIIYLVPVSGSPDPDHYMEWIWTTPEAAEPAWVCIGDTSTDTPKYVDVTGTVSGTTQTVDLTHNRFSRIAVDGGATELVINVPAEEADRVGWFRFDFTLPEETVMERVRVLDSTGTECMRYVPMHYTGPVTYKGEVVDTLVKIIGYPDPSYVDPLNPLGLPDYTIRLKFDTTDEPAFSHGEATLVESSRGGWSIWDLTYASSDWTQLLYGQTHLVEVLGANSTNVTNMTGLFNGCSNLERLAIFDTSMVDNMVGIFGNCAKIETMPDFDYSEVTNMCYAFTNCSALKAFIAETPSLRIAKNMFSHCHSLETVEFDSSRLTDFTGMFQGCRRLVHGPDIDTASAKTMHQMFDSCLVLEDVPQYDTGKVTDFYETFNYCIALTTVPSLDTSSAKTMEMMFCNCSSLTEAPEMNTPTVENMKYMFQSCSALKTVPTYSTDSLEECDAMFSGSGITEVPDMDFSKVKVLDSLFAGCMNLTTIPLLNLNNAVSVNYMFSYCNNVEHGAFNLYSSLLDISKLTEHVDVFKECGKDTESGLEELNRIDSSWGGYGLPPFTLRLKFTSGVTPSFTYGTAHRVTELQPDNVWDLTYENTNWQWLLSGQNDLIAVIDANTKGVTNMAFMFRSCPQLETISNYETWTKIDMSEVEFSYCMFWSCTALRKFEIPPDALPKVENCKDMYYDCSLLSGDITLNLPAATATDGMFRFCSSITSATISMPKNTCLDYTFYKCGGMTSVTLTNTDSVTSAAYAFYVCPNLETAQIDRLPCLTNAYYMFWGCSNLHSISLYVPELDNAGSMFTDCVKLESVVLQTTNTLSDMMCIFKNCTSLSTVSVSDTSNVEDIYEAFRNCGITSVPNMQFPNASNAYAAFCDCTKVQSGAYSMYQHLSSKSRQVSSHDDTFTNCADPSVTSGVEDLDKIPTSWGGTKAPWLLLEFTEGITPSFSTGTATQVSSSPNVWKLKTPGVTSWNNLLSSQSALIAVLDSDSSEITNMSYMFHTCSNLQRVVKLDTSKTTTCYRMFYNCFELTAIPEFNLSECTTISYMFDGCSTLAGPINIDAPKLTNASYAFYGSGITEIGKLNLPSVTSAYCMFMGCAALTKICTIYMPKAYSVYSMFANCSSMKTVDAVYFPTTNRTVDANSLFASCQSITSVGRIVIPYARYTYNMFNGCTSLEQIPYIDFSLNQVTDSSSMFRVCQNVQSGSYDMYSKLVSTGRVTSYYNTFTECGINSASGREDLLKIPTTWGGLGPESEGTVTIGGREYKTIRRGNKEWLAENLDYKFDGCAISTASSHISTTVTTPAAWYYNDDEQQYGIDGEKKCGLLYNGYAIQYLDSNKSTLLPDGWRLPKFSDWSGSFSTTGAAKIKALDNSVTANWPNGFNGYGYYGMNILPSGRCVSNTFYSIGTDGYYLHYESSMGTRMGWTHFYNTMSTSAGWSGSSGDGKRGISVRLVRDI